MSPQNLYRIKKKKTLYCNVFETVAYKDVNPFPHNDTFDAPGKQAF